VDPDPSIDLDDLIRSVEVMTPSCTDLQRLDVAVKYGDGLKGLADDLVGHFVEQARANGASWAQVGERLGVSKQAAHQRHFGRMTVGFGRERRQSRGPFERFTPEARKVIVTAQQEARDLRHNYLGVEHQLLGLSKDQVVGPLMSAAGASRDAILEQVRLEVGEGEAAPAGAIPFTPRAKQALEQAARAAGPGERILPGHILLGILELREGVGAGVLDALSVSRADLRRGARALERE
jgi:Clp amino terminal domain, pathogenicity island component